MAEHTLNIGPCRCKTGRERYRIGPSLRIPWEIPQWDKPLPLNPLKEHSTILDHDSGFDSDSTTDGHDSQGGNRSGQDRDALYNSGSESEDDSNLEFDTLADLEIITGYGVPPGIPVPFNQAMPPAGDVASSNVDDANKEVPEIAPWRINLTALSQRYNFYAAAYRGAIHIFRVRNCVDHALLSRPDVLLEPPATRLGHQMGGYLDISMPHQVNHLMIGDLGNQEILLLAYDDGDVIGYHSLQINNLLLSLQSDTPPNALALVNPFFHENVGHTAWGLAIHNNSRLIAVSSNKHEVNVFAFALTSPRPISPELCFVKHYPDSLFRIIEKSDNETLVYFTSDSNPLSIVEQMTWDFIILERCDNWRIILKSDSLTDNIPNISFNNDANGNAIEVCAVDISGTLHFIDIWTLSDTPPRVIPGLHEAHIDALIDRNQIRAADIPIPMGWGVLVLPTSSFLPTDTFQESLGLSPEEALYVDLKEGGRYIETQGAIRHIKNNSTKHPWWRAGRLNRFRSRVGTNHDMERWHDTFGDNEQYWNSTRDEAADNNEDQPLPEDYDKSWLLAGDGVSVMRTYQTDVELLSHGPGDVGIMCSHAIRQRTPYGRLPPFAPFSPERLAHLLHVPELYLVVAGSLCGRVALITLTRPSNRNYSFRRGFRIDAILPTRGDENRRLRPSNFLLGVAIGPIQTGTGMSNESLGGTRYRLMIHYYDHRILSYELFRNTLTQELSIL